MAAEKTLYLKQLSIGPMENFVYLVGDSRTKECFAVDPGWDAAGILKAAEKDGMKVTGILLTHTHYDHVNALEKLIETAGVKIYVHEEEAEFLKGMKQFVEKTKEGTQIRIGGIRIACLHTPGHTPGGQCFLIEGPGENSPFLLTGDTLFVNACGRCDLPGSDPEKMYESLKKISELPEETVLLPGHDYGDSSTSTVGKEKKQNPYYRCSGLSEFLHDRMGI